MGFICKLGVYCSYYHNDLDKKPINNPQELKLIENNTKINHEIQETAKTQRITDPGIVENPYKKDPVCPNLDTHGVKDHKEPFTVEKITKKDDIDNTYTLKSIKTIESFQNSLEPANTPDHALKTDQNPVYSEPTPKENILKIFSNPEPKEESKFPDTKDYKTQKRDNKNAIDYNINIYTLGKEINKFEDRKNEFKECKGRGFDLTFACDLLSKYVSAFLNTEGGTLYYGISDNGVVSGVTMNRRVRDLFTTAFDGCVNKFRPPVEPSYYRLNYFPVYSSSGNPLNNIYVIELEIQKGDENKIYFNHKEEAYVKRDSSVSLLKGPSLSEFTLRRCKP
jgi:Putative DNA-binding domain